MTAGTGISIGPECPVSILYKLEVETNLLKCLEATTETSTT
jgi:hypothetical protein